MTAQSEECPICEASSSVLLDARPRVPIAQNLMFDSREAAIDCPSGELRILRCGNCGFAWNARFDAGLLTYDVAYESNQSLSPTFNRHLEEVAEVIGGTVVEKTRVQAIEVGCGQGYFLHRLASVFGERLDALVGFDPAFRGTESLPPIATVIPELFNRESFERLGFIPNLLVSRHVIEHIDEPLPFLKALREASAEGTVIAVETPTIQWILDGAVAQDLYYEHCSIFDHESLQLALELAGFDVHEVSSRLGGQYILAVGVAAKSVEPHSRKSPVDNSRYPERRDSFVERWRSTFARELAAGERLAFWGGASKAVTLALLLGENCGGVEVAIDINPARQGRFLAGTGLSVASPETARGMGITKAYVMNPMYFDEIAAACRNEAWDVKLDVIS